MYAKDFLDKLDICDWNTASKVKLCNQIWNIHLLKRVIQGLLKHSYIWRYIRLLTRAGTLVLLPLLFNLMTLLTCSAVPVSLNIYYHPIIITCGHSDHSLASFFTLIPPTYSLVSSCCCHPPKNNTSLFFFLPLSLVILQLTIRDVQTKEMFLYSCSVASRVSRARCADAATWMWSRAVLKKGACTISKNLARKKTQGQKSQKNILLHF